jgi:ATP-binding cassette subfamily B protein
VVAITHDISDTLTFDRVLVMDAGTIVEQGVPRVLAERTGSRYRTLLEAERDVLRDRWSGREWRRLRMTAGRLEEAARSRVDSEERRRWQRA